MKIAYFDCPAGASGDMLLGALLDAGVDPEQLRTQLDALRLEGFQLEARRVQKAGVAATQAMVKVTDERSERRLPEIESLVQGSDLPEHLAAKALAILRRIAEVEARIHNQALDQVHLHELGGLDTVVDVAGVLLGLEMLRVERIIASPLPLGRGFVQSAHGALPLPAPATLALLQDAPITGSNLDVELVTPTGAALLAGLAHSWGAIPPMILKAVGYGAGQRDLPIPNVVRLLLGEAAEGEAIEIETLAQIETNLDDLNPQLYEHTLARLFQAGALDAWLEPIQMKKNRPAVRLCALCHPTEVKQLTEIIFAETTTLGIRLQEVTRRALPRQVHTVETRHGTVRVKAARLPDGGLKLAPEYEDCRALATKLQLPLREVYLEAEIEARKRLQTLTGS